VCHKAPCRKFQRRSACAPESRRQAGQLQPGPRYHGPYRQRGGGRDCDGPGGVCQPDRG
jgi:hypothetical protein